MQVLEKPTLRRPVLLLAFSGWVDGGQVGTSAIRFLIDHWKATKFAELDPEEFYNFSRIRPQVHLEGEFNRVITWPETAFYYHVDALLERDFVMLLGIEPNFKWRTFCEELLTVCQSIGIATAMSVGGVIADALHTRRPQIRTSTTDEELLARFPELSGRRPGYQGPTGIIGVLGDGLTRAGIPVGNMRGSVPHYIAGSPNPQVSHGLLAQVSELYGLGLDLSPLQEASRRFERQVNETLKDNPEMAEYVRKLEERTDPDPEERAEPGEHQGATTGPEDLPSGEDIIRQFEEYLRERPTQGEDGPPPGSGRS